MKSASVELVQKRKEIAALNKKFDQAAPGSEEQKNIRAELTALAKPSESDRKVKEVGEEVQLYQEVGGLIGRILLAVLIIVGMSRVLLLKVFQLPALIMLPLTYFVLFKYGGSNFMLAYGVCGLLTVAQFSYFGEYLPKVFPLHLRGTGGSFATNVGGRMVGTSMAVVTSGIVAPMLVGEGQTINPMIMAQAAGYVATGIAIFALLVGMFLPEPKAETLE